MGPFGSKQGRRQEQLVFGWAVTDAAVTSEEDQLKAEIEAWNRIHYRSDWFLRRTFGYSILASLAAVYIFWHEAPGGPSVQFLSGLWTAFLALALTVFDYRTRPSMQGWPDVAKNVPRHVALAAICLMIGIATANGIHGLSTYFDRKPESPMHRATAIEPKPPTPATRASAGLPKVTAPTKISQPPNGAPAAAPVSKPIARPVVAVTKTPVSKRRKPTPAVRVAHRVVKRAAPKRRTAKHRKTSKQVPATKSHKEMDQPWGSPVHVERRSPKPYHLNVSGG